MTYYRERYGWRDGSFPHAARISDRSIALPVGPHLTIEDMQYIGASVADVVKGLKS
jgi:dTDP-4-amino-4,6-dideoxygalactose transaminase